MTLLSVVQGVCAVVGVDVPQSVFTNITGNRTMVEMLSLANEMAQTIAWDTRDWTMFKSTVTFQGDDVTAAFDLPADFKRMLLTTNVWRSTTQLHPMRFLPDYDEWLNRRSRDIYNPYAEWTIVRGQLLTAPAMKSTISCYFPYLVKNCIKLASGGAGTEFMADGDSFLLDERILKLGMIWRWKSQKGSPYQEDMSTYETAIGMVAGHDSPSPIMVGHTPISSTARTAYPWPVPYP